MNLHPTSETEQGKVGCMSYDSQNIKADQESTE